MLEEEEPSKRTAALVALLRRFSKERITKAQTIFGSISIRL